MAVLPLPHKQRLLRFYTRAWLARARLPGSPPALPSQTSRGPVPPPRTLLQMLQMQLPVLTVSRARMDSLRVGILGVLGSLGGARVPRARFLQRPRGTMRRASLLRICFRAAGRGEAWRAARLAAGLADPLVLALRVRCLPASCLSTCSLPLCLLSVPVL